MGKSFRNIVFRICIVVLIINPCSHLFALNPDKTINQYGHNIWLQQSGLPANAIYACLQTNDGYLWLGTSSGLFCFDGAEFIKISTNPQDTRINETISVICLSKDSSLWIGTAQSGLRRIKDGKVFVYGKEDGIPELQIRALFESRSGLLWVGTSYGLFKYVDDKFISVPIHPSYINCVTEDPKGRIWVGTQNGIYIFDEKQGKQIDSIKTTNGLPVNEILTLFDDHQLNIIIGTSNGLAKWKKDLVTLINGNNAPSDKRINAICRDRDGNLWVGTPKGIYRLANNKWTMMTALDGLTNNNILSMFEDYEGSLWVGTWEGLNRYRDVNITPYTTADGLASDYICNIIETKDSSLYFLSNVDPLVTRLKNNRFIKSISTLGGSTFASRDGGLWIGRGQLLYIKNDRIRRYDSHAGLPGKWISAITEDDKSIIIFLESLGLRRFINGKIEPYLMKDGKQYPSTEYVVCLCYQPNGDLWIGTTHGLVRIRDGESVGFGPKDGMAGNRNYSIFDDGKGSLWISSPFEGLTRYKDGKFTAYTVKDGLFNNELYNVLCDNDGDLWISSPTGIGHIKKQNIEDYDAGRVNSLQTQVYVTADGMKIDECFSDWQPAAWKTHDGCIWFATKKGPVMIDPGAFRKNELLPPILIERVVVDEQTTICNQPATFTPGSDKFEFHYTALSFLVPERVMFKYKLEGYDREWVDAKTRRVAFYTNLPPGDYQFRVIACNNDGFWNEKGASFTFTLKPRFFQTYWFLGLVIITLVGMVYGLIRLRLWQHTKKEKELQERIREATANIKMLGGLIPICSNCKKIRDDQGYWDKLEEYIQNHSEAKFSHSICPECLTELYPEMSFSSKNIKREKKHKL